MHANVLTTLALFGSLASALPATDLVARQAKPCFIVGNQQLPAETSTVVNQIQGGITCNANAKTIDNVPDVTFGGQTFSQINFATSGKSPMAFALETFTTAEPLAESNLDAFKDALNVYLATEAALRSTGSAQVAFIKAPKFFLEMQVSRIETARGQPPTDPGLQVDHLRGKVADNSGSADKALLGQVDALAKQLQ
ncbi:hypothetical protein yc1106_04941 [Curvularia clavata]|uniref:DUF7143 domain-containing protein n=1 Tax=Curvularia clavata TaxID=95742 RepID=A0A9Q8Z790_CURCL|nr:hypothetical protein yc1106_04941 [Curvularia clavata]